MWYMRLIETGYVPDWLVRCVLRVTLNWTLSRLYKTSLETSSAEKRAMIEKYNRTLSHSIKKKNRCKICGRPRGYLRKFDMCRICFRTLANKGEIPGVTKASW